MKIAFFGSHKVGKTMLAEELLENLPEYTLEMEPYYQMESSGYAFSESPNPEDFVEQFNFSVELICQRENKVLFDRCVLDILAYLHILDPKRNIQQLFNTALTTIADIDLLVFVPIEKPDLIPPHQIELPKLRNQVNDLLDEWIHDFQIEVLEVNGSLSNRRNQVLSRIFS